MLEENRQDINSEQDGYLKISLVNQGMSIRKKRVCPLKDVAKEVLDKLEIIPVSDVSEVLKKLKLYS
jgi:hypothetical protein